ncbi:hypothetical protein LCGC14_2067010 [marine sediment metagenome]|uniref:TNase-like domain-containing protein n=1 Tax=marine sediment metagenome TaxID=412755 RepID=A0A0F9F6V0_9ZZZZ
MTVTPAALFRGRTVRVHSLNCVEVELQLGFGVSIKKLVLLEGIEQKDIPRSSRSEAKHCLVVLVGGKKVLVQADAQRKDNYVVGRVFLDEKVYGDPEGMMTPHGMDKALLEISTFYAWLATQKYDIQEVKAVLNGDGKVQARG